MTDVQTASELEDEQEVDLSSAWQRLKVRWWLPIGGLLVGAVIGIALAVSGGSVWRAQTIVYLGQPFAPLGGGQIQSLATNPRTVGEIIRSESVLKEVSEATGIPVSKLRSSISTRELLAAGQLRGINPLMEIAVKGSGPARDRAGGGRPRRARRRARFAVRHRQDSAPEAAGRDEPRRSSQRSTSASSPRRNSRPRFSPISRCRSSSAFSSPPT